MTYRIQATEARYDTVEAASTVRSFGPAQKITPPDKTNKGGQIAQQVITALRPRAVDQTYETGRGKPKDVRPCYDITFAIMPATLHRTVPRPTRRKIVL